MSPSKEYISPEVVITTIDIISCLLSTSTGTGSGGTDGGWEDDN